MQERDSGGYVFISHSFDEKQKAREIRNILEEEGYDAICFFLKCMTDKDELNELIKREIKAREWFVCAKSKRAEKSDWVKKECIHRLEDRGVDVEGLNTESPLEDLVGHEDIVVVNLEDDVSIGEALSPLIRDLRVNIINDSRDYEFSKNLADKLRQKDLQVTMFPNDIVAGEDYADNRERNIERAAKTGANILVLSNNSLNSMYVNRELSLALDSGSSVIPVCIDDVSLDGEYYLDGSQTLNKIRDGADLDRFVSHVGDEIKRTLNMHYK